MAEETEAGFAWMSKNGEPAEKVLQVDFGAKLWAGYFQVDGPVPGVNVPVPGATPGVALTPGVSHIGTAPVAAPAVATSTQGKV